MLILILVILLFLGNQPEKPAQNQELGGGPIQEQASLQEIVQEEQTLELPKFEKTPQLVENPQADPVLPFTHAALVMEADSGKILFSKNETRKMPIASLTKIMTAIVVAENVQDWKADVNISKKAAFAGGAAVRLKWDEYVDADQLFKAMLMNSDNGAAIALAEHVTGSTEEFAKLMNQRAKELGANDTLFTEPSGLEDQRAYSTAYDIALIAREAIKNPLITQPMLIKGPVQINSCDGAITHRVGNTNLFVKDEEFLRLAHRVVGGKTGFTYEAGYCLMEAMEDQAGQRKAIGIILNSDKTMRWYEMEEMIEWSFNNYEW
ncbi:MAG: hypothetical protein GF332_01525 [Candidatus Moranbacteria bacterium]|nr:hypothetical protein [Candidatus Moranbacteria bacterium]